MAGKIVVAGVTSLYMAVQIEDFPLHYTPSRPPAWLRSGVSGAAGHIARVLHTMGDDVTLCTMVGNDAAGGLIREELRRCGLLGPGVISAPESSLGVVLVDRQGRRMGQPYYQAVNRFAYPPDIFASAAADVDLLVLTNAGFVRPLLSHAKRTGTSIAVDVHLIADVADERNRSWLEVADIVFCSHERLPCDVADWMAQVFDHYPGCAIAAVGEGQHGCSMGLRDGRLVRVAAVAPRGVRSTAGAGDALFASFLHCWLATGNPVTALEDAVLHAGWKIGDEFPSAVCLTDGELARLRSAHPARTEITTWRP